MRSSEQTMALRLIYLFRLASPWPVAELEFVRPLTSTPMMKLQTYRATPGLDRYPTRERYAVWRAAHRQLMHADAAYRQRFQTCMAAVVVISCVPASADLPSLFGTASGIAQVALALGGAVSVCYLAFRQQHFMNQRVGSALSRHPAT